LTGVAQSHQPNEDGRPDNISHEGTPTNVRRWRIISDPAAIGEFRFSSAFRSGGITDRQDYAPIRKRRAYPYRKSDTAS
jgi:hypothetical protein